MSKKREAKLAELRFAEHARTIALADGQYDLERQRRAAEIEALDANVRDARELARISALLGSIRSGPKLEREAEILKENIRRRAAELAELKKKASPNTSLKVSGG